MTQYSKAGVEALLREQPEVLDQLQRATEQGVQQSEFAANERAREYLRGGVGRRLRVLHRTLSNMFELFPVSTVKPIERDALDDAQINLHAFIMNVYGLFDNLAWAFVLHHDLLSSVGERHEFSHSRLTGVFKRRMIRAVRAGQSALCGREGGAA